MNSTYDIVKMLLEKGAEVNSRTRDGTTALMSAAGGSGSKAIIQLLLEGGASITARDSKGKTALKYAMEANSEERCNFSNKLLPKPARTKGPSPFPHTRDTIDKSALRAALHGE